MNPSNYRPITVSSVIVKLFTKIYGARLSEVLEKEGILNDCQIGFRPGRGTADALLMMHSIIGKHKKKRRPLHLAFVDLTKAYDKVCLLLDLRTLLMCPFIFSPPFRGREGNCKVTALTFFNSQGTSQANVLQDLRIKIYD